MHLFVPGRICLFGDHSDWAGGYRRVDPGIDKGYTLICGTDQGIYVEVASHPNRLVLTATTPDGETRGPREFPMEPDALLADGSGMRVRAMTDPDVLPDGVAPQAMDELTKTGRKACPQYSIKDH